jgi:hypothetical protein
MRLPSRYEAAVAMQNNDELTYVLCCTIENRNAGCKVAEVKFVRMCCWRMLDHPGDRMHRAQQQQLSCMYPLVVVFGSCSVMLQHQQPLLLLLLSVAALVAHTAAVLTCRPAPTSTHGFKQLLTRCNMLLLLFVCFLWCWQA